MRKWIAAIIVLMLILVCVYWFIPKEVSIHQRIIIPANIKAFARKISNENDWNQWWSGKRKSQSSFEYKGNIYTLTEKKLSSLVINIFTGKDSLTTELTFIPLQSDSIEVAWSSLNGEKKKLLSRIGNSSTKNINEDIHFLLNKIQSVYSNEDNIYGFHIVNDLVADSNFIFTSTTSAKYPTTDAVYKMVDRLKSYVQKNGAKETGYPMLNIYREDSFYIAKVAVPIDKKLNDYGDIQYRWMLKGGNILITEVKGGPHQIEKAFNEMANYVDDHRRTAPAIPFQSLITDRRQEPDTNKWVTKIYWPVI